MNLAVRGKGVPLEDLRWSRMAQALLLVTTITVNAQTYVTPKLGGGQATAEMVHIDLYYDSDQNVLHADVQEAPMPQLLALPEGMTFDPAERYAVLNGAAYNSQYGWNAAGLFSMPAGAGIWVELIECSPGLETYQDNGRFGTYAPLFGTGGSSRRWQWGGAMVHNTYAVRQPPIGRYFASYHIYFGDPITGSRTGFKHLDDATVRLEWGTQSAEDPSLWVFGATPPSQGAPLVFANASAFTTNAGRVFHCATTNEGPRAGQYVCETPILVAPATQGNGGAAERHAAPGARLAMELVALSGPAEGLLRFWLPGVSTPAADLLVGRVATNRVLLSQNDGLPGRDPGALYRNAAWSVSAPGFYTLGFRLIDLSTNGPGAGPVHSPSDTYWIHLQAGLVVRDVAENAQGVTVTFAGPPGAAYHLESVSRLEPGMRWETIGGPYSGGDVLQSVPVGAVGGEGRRFFRLRAD